ncbi:Stf0 family sulfotransferase [Roseibium sp.]|uniref:Stf0 family sulfotransferase n=1 Tax=Roseibium sp. TaxID=1936156 RepID=UPI003A979560
MPSFDAYIICTSPRSGSTLLCNMLKETGTAGRPGSHFFEPSVDNWLEEYALPTIASERHEDTLRRVFEAAIARGKGGTNIFGLRMQRHSFAYFTDQLALLLPDALTDRDRMTTAFGKTLFIYLSRDDKVAQAISFVKAQQTGLWHKAPDGRELERLSPPSEPVYDFKRLRETYETFLSNELEWRDWFDRENINPITLTYEALSKDPTGATCEIVSAIGLDPHGCRHVRPGTAQLSDKTSQDWAERFRAELERC